MSDKERAAQNVTVMGGFVNLLLTGLKGFIGVITNSAGLIADAIHSLTDLATDLFVWLALSDLAFKLFHSSLRFLKWGFLIQVLMLG